MLKNLQLIKLKYLAPTNTRGFRIKIMDTRFNVSLVIDRGDTYSDFSEQAVRYLEAHGHNIVAKAYDEITKTYYLLADSFTPINQTPYAVTSKYNKELIKA